jgi:two-component system, NarL family, nitrate/nitrite sensor histidine kinase NarX
MQNIFNFPKQIHGFIRTHRLYANLHALVIAMVLTVILMQAGSLFLLNYIPDHHAVIHRAYQEQLAMQLNLYRLENNLSGKSDNFNHQNVLDDSAYNWVKSQKDTGLAKAYEQLKIAYQQYDKAISSGDSKKIQIDQCQLIISAYKGFVSEAEKDVLIKQSLVSLLQLVSLFLIFCIATSVMLTSWRVLINRLGKIVAGMPEEVTSDSAENQYNDELEELEKLVAVMSARFEAIQVETKWTNKNSTEKVRKMILAQDFLFKLTKLIGSSELNELAIKKTLASLEQVLNVSNVALVFSESGSSITTQRALFSSTWPLSFDETMFDEVIALTSISHSTKLINAVCVQCVTLPLLSPSGWLGILIVEADANRYFDEFELKLIDATAQMMAISMGFQAKEQESRRVALLEERAVIARELHDSLAQSLSYMKFQLARLQTVFGRHVLDLGMGDIVNDMREGLDNAYRELRELLTTFRVRMDVRGLDYVLEEAIEEFSQRSSLTITLDNRLQECKLSVNEEFHLLHVVREALSNIVRHSGAKKVNIALIYQVTGDVIVTIDDDGKGCTFDENKPHHYGLAIMTERAYCLGGKIDILPRRKGGTRVRLLFRPK